MEDHQRCSLRLLKRSHDASHIDAEEYKVTKRKILESGEYEFTEFKRKKVEEVHKDFEEGIIDEEDFKRMKRPLLELEREADSLGTQQVF